MGMTQVFGHIFGVIEIGNGGRKMRLPRQQNIFCTAREIGFVFLGESWKWKCIPTESVGIAEIGFQLSANSPDPYKMNARGNEPMYQRGAS